MEVTGYFAQKIATTILRKLRFSKQIEKPSNEEPEAGSPEKSGNFSIPCSGRPSPAIALPPFVRARRRTLPIVCIRWNRNRTSHVFITSLSFRVVGRRSCARVSLPCSRIGSSAYGAAWSDGTFPRLFSYRRRPRRTQTRHGISNCRSSFAEHRFRHL